MREAEGVDLVTALLGREEEMARLAELVRPGRVVTVTGPGGVGKTRLVSAFSASLPEGGVGPGGVARQVVTASLAELDRGADAVAVSQQLGFRSPEAAGLALGSERTLVVLDNCEHVRAGAAAFVSELMAESAAIAAVATSREPLRVPGEQVMNLPPLAVPASESPDVASSPAVQLFLERASAAGAPWGSSETAVAAVAELCRRLDGLPLAIEIAAARARAVGPVELLRLMEHRLDLLRDPAASGRPARHHSVRAAIDVSVELLPPDDATALRRLGVFVGPFDLDLAHAVVAETDAHVVDTVDLLTRLVDRSLVEVTHVQGSARYHLLELVREHAREASIVAGHWEDTRERFVAAMDAVSEHIVTAGLAQWRGEVLAAATAQFRNLVAAIEWTVALDERPDRSLRLMRPMLVSVHQGRSSEVLQVGTRVVERWPDVPAPWRAEVLGVLATAAAVVADAERLEAFANGALSDPDRTPVADVLAERALSLVAIGIGRPDAALAHLERGREAASASGLGPFARELQGMSLAVRQILGDDTGLMAEVQALVEQSQAAGDRVNEGLALLVRAQVLAAAAQWDEADAAVDAARRATESDGYAWWTRAVLRTRAELAAGRARAERRDPWTASAALWREAIDLSVAQGALGELATTLLAAAVVAQRAGAREAAATLARAAPPVVELSVIPDLSRAEVEAVRAAAGADPATGPSTLSARLGAALAIVDEAALADAVDGGADAGSPAPDHPVSGHPVSDPPAAAPAAELCADGDSWVVRYGGTTARVRHLKGIGDLAVLLAAPGTEVHCLQLMGGADVGGGSNAGIDDTARRTYERRIIELQADIDEARVANDTRRAELAELELDALVTQLSDALGLGGRSRSTGSAAERARSAVTYRIRAAVKRIGEAHPELGRHLRNSVRTGTWCSYVPETDIRWAVVGRPPR